MAAADPKIISRIRKLLALSDSNPNAEEAAAAAAKAEALMTEHQLGMAQIIIDQLRGENKRDHMDRKKAHVRSYTVPPEFVGSIKGVPEYVQWLAVATATLFDCHTMLSNMVLNNGNAIVDCLEFLGYASDVEVCQWTFTYLLQCIRRANSEYVKEVKSRDPSLQQIPISEKQYTYMLDSFRQGMSMALVSRIDELVESRSKNSRTQGSQALVLYQSKRDAVAEVFGQFNYPKGGDARVDPFSYNRGEAEGRKISLNTPVEGVTEPLQIRGG